MSTALPACELTRYRDVAEALREPLLVPSTARSTGAAAPIDRAGHAEFRTDALRALAPARLQALEAKIAPVAAARADALPADRPVDLVAEYAKPWSLEVARIATGVPAEECGRLDCLAHTVFLAACEPYDAALESAAQKATTELARSFQGAPSWHLQMFVALAHSLPGFLGAAWMVLLRHPAVIQRLREEPALWPAAIDELLRLAGPARAQFRRALDAMTVGGCRIARDRQVILRLDLANRDAEEFAAPEEFRFGRGGGHVAFGGGLHACVAGTLIRCAAGVATRALVGREFAECTGTVVEGFGMRYGRELLVRPIRLDIE